MHTGTITLRIDSRLENVFLVGLSVNRICTALGMPEDEAYQVELSVVEGVNNAIEHAYNGASGRPVDVVLCVGRERLHIEVRDEGQSMDWVEARRVAARHAQSEELAEGGRGLFIILSLMDEVSYGREDGVNVLTLIKRRPVAGAATG